MEKIALKIKSWIEGNKKEVLILGLILLVGAALRLYKIADYMTFLGDEGRDAIVVRRLLVNFDPILIGPGTSVGNMYLGPLYYYLMAPALWLAGFSPVGPSVQVALLGVATIFLVWWVAREWFSGKAGLIASGLYAISPTPVIFSLSSWNPNIMPFFALLSVYCLWKVWKKHNWGWLIVLGISYAFTLQSHYLGFLLAPTIILFWLLTYLNVRKSDPRFYIRYSLYGAALFVLLMSPLVIFDARHGWMNFNAMKEFLFAGGSADFASPLKAVLTIGQKALDATTRLLGARGLLAGGLVGIFILVSLAVFFSQKYYLLLAWIGFALLGLGFYRHEIYDHYYGFFFTAPFILFAGLSEDLIKKRKLLGKVLIGALVVIIVFFSIKNSHLWSQPNGQMARATKVAGKISQEAGGEKFNLAVIADRNYEDGYQYFLEVWGEPVVDIDAQRPETITDQLFAVCEKPKELCDPTHNPKTEVANFGWTKIVGEWEVQGITLFKLIHSI